MLCNQHVAYSLFQGYGDFLSQIRNYLLCNFMHHTGLAGGGIRSRVPSSVSYSLASSLLGCLLCAFIAGPSTVHSWHYSHKLSLPSQHSCESNTKY